MGYLEDLEERLETLTNNLEVLRWVIEKKYGKPIGEIVLEYQTKSEVSTEKKVKPKEHDE